MILPEAGGVVAPARGRMQRSRVVVLVLVVLALLAAGFARATSYVLHEERFCTIGCHAPRDGSASYRPHAREELECQSCHVTPLRASYSLLARRTLGSKVLPAHAKVEADRCTDCHEKDRWAFRLLLGTEGHREHKKLDCLACHGKNTHDPEPVTERLCLDCHEPARLHKTTRDAETCLSCHSYSVRARPSHVNVAMTCEGCHTRERRGAPGKQLATKVVDAQTTHGALDCKLCHEPHGKTPPPPATKEMTSASAFCARCHQLALSIEGVGAAMTREEHRRCEGCHAPHAPRKATLDSCARCHEQRAKARGAALGGTATVRRHDACASCHLPHGWRAEPNGCVGCHAAQAASLRAESPAKHDTCARCHELHGPPATSDTCKKCHKAHEGGHRGAASEKHEGCTTCHAPHAATKAAARASCGGCHEAALADLGGAGSTAHGKKGCTGCHEAHADAAAPAGVCDKCHGEKARAVASAEPPKHRACASCHVPHRFAFADGGAPAGRPVASPELAKGTRPDLPAPQPMHKVEAACAKCHEAIVAAATIEGATHKGACKDCHAMHGSPKVARAACLGCHEPVRAAFKAAATDDRHAKCGSCHAPHRPAKKAGEGCAKCHAPEAKVAAAWPAGSDHEKGCAECHRGHDVRVTKKCATCHAKQAASAGSGKHSCAQCHPPHKTPPAPKKGPSAGAKLAWWSGCGDCHKAQAAAAAALGPQHSECKSCHESHRFAAVGCDSCHPRKKQKGGHTVAEHAAKCTACHDPHVKAEVTAARCVSCHKKVRDPERCRRDVDRATCDRSCHSFR